MQLRCSSLRDSIPLNKQKNTKGRKSFQYKNDFRESLNSSFSDEDKTSLSSSFCNSTHSSMEFEIEETKIVTNRVPSSSNCLKFNKTKSSEDIMQGKDKEAQINISKEISKETGQILGFDNFNTNHTESKELIDETIE